MTDHSIKQLVISALLVMFCMLGASSLVQADELKPRSWVSIDGQFKTDAVLVSQDEENVVLRKKNGITITVPLNLLGKADLKYLKKQMEPLRDDDRPAPDSMQKQGYSVTKIEIDATQVVEELQWSSDGKFLFTLDKQGLLRKFAIPSCQQVGKVDLAGAGSWLSQSKLGLVATLSSTQEICVIDEKTLKVIHRHKTPGATRAASSLKLSVAYVTDGGGSGLVAMDLKSGKIKATQSKAPFHNAPRVPSVKHHPSSLGLHSFKHVYPLPTGKHVLCVGTECIYKFRVSRNSFVLEEVGPRLGAHPKRLEISADGKLVAMPSGGGNYEIAGHPQVKYGTYIYDVKNLQLPKFAITTGHYPRALTIDPVTQRIYAQNYDKQLIVLSKGGAKQAEYELEKAKDSTRQLLAHPSGNKLCVLTGTSLYWIVLDELEE